MKMNLAQGNTDEASKYLAQIDFSDSPISSMIFQAEKSYYLQEHGAALKLYRNLQEHYKENFINVKNGYLAIHMAAVYIELEMFDDAKTLLSQVAEQYQQKILQRNNNPVIYYNMAMVKTLQEEESDALLYMQSAIDAGWSSSWQVDIEPIFKKVSDNEQFSLMMGGVKAKVATMRTRLASDQSFVDEQEDFFNN